MKIPLGKWIKDFFIKQRLKNVKDHGVFMIKWLSKEKVELLEFLKNIPIRMKVVEKEIEILQKGLQNIQNIIQK